MVPQNVFCLGKVKGKMNWRRVVAVEQVGRREGKG
jgi:hypothetical protein